MSLEEPVPAVICLGYPLVSASNPASLRDAVLMEMTAPVLFVRGARDANGASYYQRCLGILSGIEEAESIVMDGPHSPRGALRVILPMSFFRVTVTPHLPRFLRE